jgi:hypothetical protein
MNAYIPEEKFTVERANEVVVTKMRALLRMTGLPVSLWAPRIAT